MNQRQLTYFITVLENRSIKKAAKVLMISPQGLSKTIQSLENEIGNSLFVRTKKGLTPTIYAKKLHPHALKIIQSYEELNNDFMHFEKEIEIFNVVTTYDFICLLNSDFIQKFYEINPNVQLNLIEMTDYPAIEKLRNNEVELAILPSPLDTTLFQGDKLLTSRHCLIINEKNPLAHKDEIEYKDLINQPLSLKGREYVMYNNNINRFLSAGTTPTIYMETSSNELIADLARNNISIGVSLDYIVKNNLPANCIIRPFADQTCARTLYIAKSKNTNLSKTAISFKKLLLEYFKHEIISEN